MSTFNILGASDPVLKTGSTGETVKNWQNILNWTVSKAKPLAVDGIFGANTRSATIALQQILGVTADGIVGSATMAAFRAKYPSYAPSVNVNTNTQAAIMPQQNTGTAQSYINAVTKQLLPGATLKQGDNGAAVRTWQNALNWTVRKNNLLTVDGIFGSATRAATIELQKLVGVTPDGVVGQNTVAAYQSRYPGYLKNFVLSEQKTTSYTSPLPSYTPSTIPSEYSFDQPQSTQAQASAPSTGVLGIPLLGWAAIAATGILILKKRGTVK